MPLIILVIFLLIAVLLKLATLLSGKMSTGIMLGQKLLVSKMILVVQIMMNLHVNISSTIDSIFIN